MTTDSISTSDSYAGLTVPTTGVSTKEGRDRLEETLFSVLKSRQNTLIDAPTSLGKSYTIATTRWREYPEVTGGNLIIHIHQTTEARDEAVKASKGTDGLRCHVLEGREDCCPTAAGDYDDQFRAPNGLAPSEWFEWMCDVRKFGFGKAHSSLSQVRDLPCSTNGTCSAIRQWWDNLRDDEGNPTVDVVHTTANFAHVGELIDGANLIFDERPNYALTLRPEDRQQLRDSISNLLRYRSTGKKTLSHIVTAATGDDRELKQELRELLDTKISEDWYFDREETHRLAPEIGLAMLGAEEVFAKQWVEENKFARRWVGEYDGVKVVMDGNGKLRHVQHCPDLSDARCILGLDAFPSPYRWELNTVIDLQRADIMSGEERRVWRRNERGLEVIQVGDATRSYTGGWDGAGKDRCAGLIGTLREKHGQDFRTGITAKKIKQDVRQQMESTGIEEPELMHYGGQNSRNDFEEEAVGALLGCIDPGDETILDLLALGWKEAWPEMTTTEEGDLVRMPGRSFCGPDADTASELLESVRASNLAQAAGRYARSPDESDSSALVYVWSDACPDSMIDEVIDTTYMSFTDKQRSMVDALRNGNETLSSIVEVTGCDRSYTNGCLGFFYDRGLVRKSVGTGKDGATEWTWIGGDMGETESVVILDS